MSDPKLAKAVQKLLKQAWKLYRRMTKATVTWLLRTALIVYGRRPATAGFVLPTAVMLLLVVGLTAGALTYRAFNSSTRAIGESQSRVVYNAATPAVDRARTKLEYLFDSNKDTRYPGGVPSDEFLTAMLFNDGSTIKGKKVVSLPADAATDPSKDPYTLPDETRVDINGDGNKDNAWSYQADTDGDGTKDSTVVYSIISSLPPDQDPNPAVPGDEDFGWKYLISLTDTEKATGKKGGTSIEQARSAGARQSIGPNGPRIMSYTRGAPLTSSPTATTCGRSAATASVVEAGWYGDEVSTSLLRKNFQVDVLVVKPSGQSPNFTTLEFQQDRQLDRGNKWGAWFRNDLEIFPGPQFQWNGAMHTEGSLFIGGSSFSAYLISSPSSCLFYASASEITVTDVNNPNATTPANNNMKGMISSGTIRDDNFNGSSLVFLHNDNFDPAIHKATLNSGSDSVKNGAPTPAKLSIDPKVIQLENGYRSRNVASPAVSDNRAAFDPDYKPRPIAKRMIPERPEPAPYVDDTFRADNRYGPKLKYNDQPEGSIPAGKKSGDSIPFDMSNEHSKLLVKDTINEGEDATSVGLDGYWERRARNQGLRILVGQRLELGNPFGWVSPQDRPATKPSANYPEQAVVAGDGDLLDLRRSNYNAITVDAGNYTTDGPDIDPDFSDNEGDPLYPPHSLIDLPHEKRQQRALRDNLSAVQSTAIYHAAVSRDYPIACFASTAHAGSPFALKQSVNFVPTFFVDSATAVDSRTDTILLTDFLLGRGSNGWEFEPPSGSEAQFKSDIANAASPLRIAIQNLAYFAGDHISDARTGAFPPTQEAGQIHPDPELTMWGNFSNLRRALAELDANGYDKLSPADKTYLQTAACTVGMLAYQIDRVQRFDPRNPWNDILRGNSSLVVSELGTDLWKLMDGIVDERPGAIGNFEVLPKQRLSKYGYTKTGTGTYNPRDYDRVPAEAFLGALRAQYMADATAPDPINNAKLRLAELIFEKFQVQRDRTYGFRASPAANTWNFNPYVVSLNTATYQGVTLWSSACDPNIFAFRYTPNPADPTSTVTYGDGAKYLADVDADRIRLGLSRLCGTVVPVGGVRNMPGDSGFPLRNTDNDGVTIPTTSDFLNPTKDASKFLTFIPKTDSSPYVLPTGLKEGLKSQGGFTNLTTGNYPITDVNKPYNGVWDTTVNAFTQDQFLRGSVLPKWPSLYYLFPEFDHNQDGSIVQGVGVTVTGGIIDTQGDGIGKLNTPDKDSSDDLDQLQPTGTISSPDTRPAGTALPSAYQPWAEPYVTDSYVNTANSGVMYRVVDSGVSGNPIIRQPLISGTPVNQIPAAYDNGKIGYEKTITGGPAVPLLDDPGTPAVVDYLKLTYRTYDSQLVRLGDKPVGAVALKPRKLPAAVGVANPFPLQSNSDWQLPVFKWSDFFGADNDSPKKSQNVPTNHLLAPTGDTTRGTIVVTPFLDRVLYNGRELMSLRAMDIDLGLLRRVAPNNQVAGNTEFAPNDVWLPISGLVYAFREDAIREDAINRPAAGTATNVTDATTSGTDPALGAQNISLKPVDFIPDPDRRAHGFRLRNGAQLQRHSSLNVPAKDNIRGLSLFTDDLVYIMGSGAITGDGAAYSGFNLHQTINEDGNGTRIEEFTQLLPGGNYNPTQFYTDRTTQDARFADPAQDSWRPVEILADGISIISRTFCDGTAMDSFMAANASNIDRDTRVGSTTTESGTGAANLDRILKPYWATPDTSSGARVYDTSNPATGSAQFGQGCEKGKMTSFLNQTRPKTGAFDSNWLWARENAADFFAPVKISRNGEPLMVPVTTNNRQKPMAPIPYPLEYLERNDNKNLMSAENARVNAVIISGIVPSQRKQAYGGMHNFPRFLEDWSGQLWFSGSFLQLNFSNYGTAPFDQDAWEPGESTQNREDIRYYDPPDRLWGYDVALQLAPAGPAASRFIKPGRTRNEYYAEVAVNDPYIRNLCLALDDSVLPDARCPQ